MTAPIPAAPVRVLCVGDTHSNLPAWSMDVEAAIAHEAADLVIQVGDFGWWPSRAQGFIDRAAAAPVPVYFIDGNHEHHIELADAVARTRATTGQVDGPVPLAGNLSYLPRGTRLALGGVTVCVMGGAHSIDRASLHPGRGWFPQEAIGDADIERAEQGGPADVLISHDAPAGWTIPNLAPRPAAVEMAERTTRLRRTPRPPPPGLRRRPTERGRARPLPLRLPGPDPRSVG